MTTLADMGYGPVERAVRAELRALGKSVQSDGSAAAVVAVARHVDQARGAASAAAAAREVRISMTELRGGPPEVVDPVLADLFAALA